MSRKISYELTDQEEQQARDATQPYRKQINSTPALLSILYDIDLLPEQIVMMVNASRMIAVCELFKVLTEEQITKLVQEGGR